MSSPFAPGNQPDEKATASALVKAACKLNRRCRKRKKPNGDLEEYSGFVVDEARLESAIYSPFLRFGGEVRFESPYDVAAALLINIATGHPFHDGNKRTALHLSLSYLHLCKIEIVPPSEEMGAKLVEDAVKKTKIPYEERRIFIRSKLQEWTVPNQTALDHRTHIGNSHASE